MEKQIEKIIAEIRKNRGVLSTAAARDEAEARLGRLKTQVDNLERRRSEIESEGRAVEGAMAELIASGQPPATVDQARQRIADLKAELDGITAARAALEERAMPKAREEVKEARERLNLAATARIDVARRLLEDELAATFDAAIASFGEWDKAWGGLLAELRIPHMADPERFGLRVTSEALIGYAVRHLQADIEVDRWRMQLADDRSRFAVNQDAEQAA